MHDFYTAIALGEKEAAQKYIDFNIALLNDDQYKRGWRRDWLKQDIIAYQEAFARKFG